MAPLRPGILRTFRLKRRTESDTHEELDEELRFHLEARARQFMRAGMSETQAYAEAERRMGLGAAERRAELRASAVRRDRRLHRRQALRDLTDDLSYAWRGMSRRPGFTLVAVLTLAIGIGGSTALFSAVHSLILRPLPFEDPEALTRVTLVRPGPEPRSSVEREFVWSYPKYAAFRDEQQGFSHLALYADGPATITDEDPEQVRAELVGATYFTALGVRPALGRGFLLEDDEGPGTRRSVVLGEALWTRRYGADSTLVGRTVPIDGESYLVVGVAPPGFSGLTGRADLFMPVMSWSEQDLSEPYSHVFNLVARRAATTTLVQAQQMTARLGDRVDEIYPGGAEEGAWGAKAEPLDSARLDSRVRRSVLILFGAGGFVLLVVCLNLTNLLLGRTIARRSDFAVRSALGAPTSRIVRLLMTESGLLAGLGGLVGLAVGWAGVAVLRRIDPIALLRSDSLGLVTFSQIRLELLPVAFALSLTALTALVCGVAPALEARRSSLRGTLQGTRRGGLPGLGHLRLGRSALVVVQVAAAVVLLAGSGLTLRSLGQLIAVDPGFEPDNILTVRFAVPVGGGARDSLPGFYERITERLGAVPGVEAVGLADCPPLNGGCNSTLMAFPDRSSNAENQGVGVHWTSPGWFDALGVEVRRGRGFGPGDVTEGQKVVLVSATAAERFWPGGNPIGERVEIFQGGFHEGARVVGVVNDVRFGSLEDARTPEVYLPISQSPRPRLMVFVRTSTSAGDAGALIRSALREVAPDLPLYDVRTLEDRTAMASAPSRFAAGLLTGFAGLALLLAMLGIYGVMSFVVVQRSHEIGVRMAMGADRGRILRLILRQGMLLTVTGGIVGVLLAALLTRVLEALLFEVTPTDPAVFGSALLLLGVTAAAATWFPARYAARQDPKAVLRA